MAERASDCRRGSDLDGERLMQRSGHRAVVDGRASARATESTNIWDEKVAGARGGNLCDTCFPQTKSALLRVDQFFRAVIVDCQRSPGPPSQARERVLEDGGL